MTPKTMTPEEAAALLAPTDSLHVPLGTGQPGAFLHALGAVRSEWDDFRLYSALLVDFYEVVQRPGVTYYSGFFSLIDRMFRDGGANVQFVPSDFRRFAPILEAKRPRVVATVATPPDAEGWCSLSLHAGASVEAIHACGADPDRLLVVETNANFPRTLGLPPDNRHAVHIDEIDVLVESDRVPFVLADAEPTDIERAIATHAARFVHDGCTLQTGIGGIPSTIASILAEGPGGGYGVHSEMFTTGLMHLHRAGKVTNRKGEFDGYSITTFAAGTAELYEWLDGNTEVRFLPVSIVNSPELIAGNEAMVTINGAVTIDLAGQVVADTIGGRQFSGIGGHEDFVGGGGMELQDRSLVCLPSTATVDGSSISRIVAALPAGTVVTTPRHQIDVVITEHGAAELRGLTVRERAAALAAIAHPQFRADLEAAAAVVA